MRNETNSIQFVAPPQRVPIQFLHDWPPVSEHPVGNLDSFLQFAPKQVSVCMTVVDIAAPLVFKQVVKDNAAEAMITTVHQPLVAPIGPVRWVFVHFLAVLSTMLGGRRR